jgi:hypothetical protein
MSSAFSFVALVPSTLTTLAFTRSLTNTLIHLIFMLRRRQLFLRLDWGLGLASAGGGGGGGAMPTNFVRKWRKSG